MKKGGINEAVSRFKHMSKNSIISTKRQVTVREASPGSVECRYGISRNKLPKQTHEKLTLNRKARETCPQRGQSLG